MKEAKRGMMPLGLLAILVVAAALFWPQQTTELTDTDTAPPGATQAVVKRVVDGDTVQVVLPDKRIVYVRLIGINTPEEDEPGYQEATDQLANLLPQGSAVTLEYDTRQYDKYHRELCYVWVEDGNERSMINMRMVESGHAKAAAYPPDTKWQAAFEAAEELRAGR